MVKVVFTHDDLCRKWDAHVEGAKDVVEARQAFSAVVLTCQELNPSLLKHTRALTYGTQHTIVPAV